MHTRKEADSGGVYITGQHATNHMYLHVGHSVASTVSKLETSKAADLEGNLLARDCQTCPLLAARTPALPSSTGLCQSACPKVAFLHISLCCFAVAYREFSGNASLQGSDA